MMVGSPGEMLVRRERRHGCQSSLKTDSECLVWALERAISLQKSVCERSNVKLFLSGQSLDSNVSSFELKSLILAQIERWRHA